MKFSITKFIKPVHAHCDLPCGVYDPAQAKIEATSLLAIATKYDGLDELGKQRAVIINEQRAELVKHHLMVLWADYFKPEHAAKYPGLHEMFWTAIKQASECKHHMSVDSAQELLAKIDEIATIFAETKAAA